ncbi:MAG: DUF5686 and carboxypeptidase regulatory-like domain-containing protein, partial [Rhodothermia bacterium]|nr:DUF5686 and carboxypeptidase regulatory-like domain-containing protein [Rhodothermia bacterium]
AHAQLTIHGVVRDAKTGATLAATNIGIENTTRGTISNADGAYSLRVPTLPATVVFRFIGYRTASVTVTNQTDPRIHVSLEPVTIQLDEVVVTGDNPAIDIMRRVIERKARMIDLLASYEVDAYNRFAIENDTGIVSILESVTRTYWEKDRGRREVVTFERKTNNLDFDEALPAAMFVANLYEDDVEISGYTFFGVTHPDALDNYRFGLLGTRYIDDRLVYDISVEPRTKLTVGFAGTVAVLSEDYVLLEVDLRPGDAFLYPPPIQRYDLTMRQQYREFEGGVWLPVDYRSRTILKIGAGRLLYLPPITVDQVSRFTHYRINVDVPDSLYESDREFVVDSTAILAEDASELETIMIPLSGPEQIAYQSIDSTMTLDKAFKPGGLFASQVQFGEDADRDSERGSRPVTLGGAPTLRYNRVDGLRMGGAPSVSIANGGLAIGGEVAYSTALKEWSWEVNGEVASFDRLTLGGSYTETVAPNYTSEVRPVLENSVRVLLGGSDYFDYHSSKGWTAFANVGLDPVPARFHVALRSHEHVSVAKQTDYDLVGESTLQPANPAINEGRLGAIVLGISAGEPPPALAVTGSRRIKLEVERAASGFLGSDFEYTRLSAVGDWQLPTFFRRRLLPNTLDVRVTASTHNGPLPSQRLSIIDTSDGPLTPFGTLRTAGDRPVLGDRTLAVFWEHNFRTV